MYISKLYRSVYIEIISYNIPRALKWRKRTTSKGTAKRGKKNEEEGKEKKDDAKAEDGEKPEGGDENDGEDPVQETRIDVEVPKISTDLGQEVNFIKLPNFLSVDCRPFDPETYEDEIDDDDVLDEEGKLFMTNPWSKQEQLRFNVAQS